ncbi:uncharacterized protein LOC142230900 [Haematobia irritans]|uniref:uncharacterized protein LOC142230900 n=1 Tax=Haematobia irritans TaxID=7368 RepID=UPI003F50A3FD
MPSLRTPKRQKQKESSKSQLNATFGNEENAGLNSSGSVGDIRQSESGVNTDNNGYLSDEIDRRFERMQNQMQQQMLEMQQSILSHLRNVSIHNVQGDQSNVAEKREGEFLNKICHTDSKMILNNSVESASSPSVSSGIVPKTKKIYPLPEFNGTPEEWQIFIEDFRSTTREFGYSSLQNIIRLREALKGRAKESVEDLLSNSPNVEQIIEMLEETYGRPEQLIRSQICGIRKISPVADGDMDGIVSFANKVLNMTTFLKNWGGIRHLSNPELLSELVSKLPLNYRVQWAEKWVAIGDSPTISEFSDWLISVRRVANIVLDDLPVVKPRNTKNFTEKSGHRVPKCFKKSRCHKCDKKHHILLHKDFVQDIANTDMRNCHGDRSGNDIIFQVVPVNLYGNKKKITTYAFVDDGSNTSIINEELIKELGIKGKKDSLNIQWLNQQTCKEDCQNISVKISEPEQSKYSYTRKCSSKKYFASYGVVKPQMIISLNHAFLTTPLEAPVTSMNSGLVGVKTRLGWIIFGPKGNNNNVCRQRSLSINNAKSVEENKLRNMMEQYFNMETFGIKPDVKPVLSNEDNRAMAIMNDSVCKVDGRYACGLLWREDFR